MCVCVFLMSAEEGVRLSGAGVMGGASRPTWVLGAEILSTGRAGSTFEQLNYLSSP